MRQALHILKKDVRYLRLEIGLMLAMAATFALAYDRTYPWWALLAVAGAYRFHIRHFPPVST